eukprot:SAG25_NODE_5846_length_614_cov_85.906796_1_plen_151_part_01
MRSYTDPVRLYTVHSTQYTVHRFSTTRRRGLKARRPATAATSGSSTQYTLWIRAAPHRTVDVLWICTSTTVVQRIYSQMLDLSQAPRCNGTDSRQTATHTAAKARPLILLRCCSSSPSWSTHRPTWSTHRPTWSTRRAAPRVYLADAPHPR